jgi:hypothetical protein
MNADYAVLGIIAKMPCPGKCRVGPIEVRNSRGIQGFLTTRLGIFQAIFHRRFRIAETGQKGCKADGLQLVLVD